MDKGLFWFIIIFVILSSPIWIYVYARIISGAVIRSWAQYIKGKLKKGEDNEKNEKKQ